MLSKKSFHSQAEAERLEPVPGAAMISITDPDKSLPLSDVGQLYRDSSMTAAILETSTDEGSVRMITPLTLTHPRLKSCPPSWMDWLVAYRSDLRSLLLRRIRSGAVALYSRTTWIHSNKPITSPTESLRIAVHPTKFEPLMQAYERNIWRRNYLFTSNMDFSVAVGLRR
nr:hypothetical protein [Escherichia coli]